jgi:hypothetical protein
MDTVAVDMADAVVTAADTALAADMPAVEHAVMPAVEHAVMPAVEHAVMPAAEHAVMPVAEHAVMLAAEHAVMLAAEPAVVEAAEHAVALAVEAAASMAAVVVVVAMPAAAAVTGNHFGLRGSPQIAAEFPSKARLLRQAGFVVLHFHTARFSSTTPLAPKKAGVPGCPILGTFLYLCQGWAAKTLRAPSLRLLSGARVGNHEPHASLPRASAAPQVLAENYVLPAHNHP